jgi:hypothetical protein
MEKLTPIELYIVILDYQMSNMSDKTSDAYLTIKACKELAKEIFEEFLNK